MVAVVWLQRTPHAEAATYTVSYSTGIVSPDHSNVSTDMADVNISIVSERMNEVNFTHNVTIGYAINVRNAREQHASILLAYTAISQGVDITALSFECGMEGEEQNYTLDSYQSTSLPGTYEQWAAEASGFHILNITLEGYTNALVSIDVRFQVWTSADYFNLKFAMGSSLPWGDSAFQDMKISVLNATAFHSIDFEPKETLNVIRSAIDTTGTWHFNMSNFSEDFVGVTLQQNVYMPPGYNPTVPAALIIMTIFLVGSYILWKYTRTRDLGHRNEPLVE